MKDQDEALIPEIPSMPDEIINAIDNNKLLLFVGAGVSKLFGYPLWSELGRKLADKAVESGVITRSQKEILFSSNFTPMQIITILSKHFDDYGGEKKGIDYVIEELSCEKDEKSKKNAYEITKYLSAYNATIVTTNADKTLEESEHLKDRVLLKSFINYKNEFDNYALIHLHGSISEPDNMVFTSKQYAKAYTVDEDFGQKLKELFQNDWTILFIGYGVAEFELIRYFLKKSSGKDRKLFLLEGYLAKDQTIKYQFDCDYYDSLGITLIPYSREKEDYQGMINVLKEWNKTVQTKTFAGSIVKENAIKSIVAKEPTEESIQALITMVNKK